MTQNSWSPTHDRVSGTRRQPHHRIGHRTAPTSDYPRRESVTKMLASQIVELVTQVATLADLNEVGIDMLASERIRHVQAAALPEAE